MEPFSAFGSRSSGVADAFCHCCLIVEQVAAEFLCYLEKATSGSIDTQLHPCLYPILLLFASLSAEGDVPRSAQRKLAAIRACYNHYDRVRRMHLQPNGLSGSQTN